MISKKHITLVIAILFFIASNHAQTNATKQYQTANNYFKEGAFEKALVIYKKLHTAKPYNQTYSFKLIETYQQLEQYDASQKLIETLLNKTKRPPLIVELGYNYQLKKDTLNANKFYKQALDKIDEKAFYVYGITQRLENHSLLPQAIEAYTKASKLLPNKNFSLQLARLHADKGDIKNMFSSYIDYIDYKPSVLATVKRKLSEFVSENKTAENNKILRTQLLKKLQADPNAKWYQLLSWLYVQEKQYSKSFVQERALYKRNPESLDRLLDLAQTAQNNNDNETAIDIFNFILEASQDKEIKLQAHQFLLEMRIENANKKELEKINNDYLELFKTFGKSKITLQLQLSYGHFLAFNYNDPKTASKFLKQTSKLDITPNQLGLVKLKLADILVFQEKFNEALIFYTQIKTNLKNSALAQDAAFKIAKTSYYKGDFDWAESQLKVLKASTTQLIANDALDLKLLISDNKWDDSTKTALKYYAKADLFAYQKKTTEAIKLLDTILTEHYGETITDQALYKQAKLHQKQQNYEKAEVNYKKIIADYRDGILIDDAYYFLAELYYTHLDRPDEAKSFYEKIIFNHEDSIYFVEARKKYRKLRGDTIN